MAVASDPAPVLTPKIVELETTTERLAKNEAKLMAESGREPGEWCPPQPTSKTQMTTLGETQQERNDQTKSALGSVAPASAIAAESTATVAVAVDRDLIDKQKEAALEQDSTTFDIGLLPIAELFPNAEHKAAALPTLPMEVVDSGEVAALVQAVNCTQVNRGSSSLPRGAYGGGIAFGWGARYALAKPVDAKGFKVPIRDDSFVTLRLNKRGSDVVSGGLRVVVKFLLDQNTRFFNTEPSVSTDPSRPWAV